MRSLSPRCCLVLAVFSALVGLLRVPTLPAQEYHPVPISTPDWGASLDEVRESMGSPAFASASILNYTTVVRAGDRSLVAGVTFWFKSNELFFTSYAFPVEDRAAELLAADFQAVSLVLKESFGDPLSITSQPDAFTTEVWSLSDTEIEHTVILDPARSDHTISMTARLQ